MASYYSMIIRVLMPDLVETACGPDSRGPLVLTVKAVAKDHFFPSLATEGISDVLRRFFLPGANPLSLPDW